MTVQIHTKDGFKALPPNTKITWISSRKHPEGGYYCLGPNYTGRLTTLITQTILDLICLSVR